MSKTNGRMLTCDRCKKTTFEEVVGTKDMDGGFTKWTRFKEAEGWTHEYWIGDLCPECSAEYECMKAEFASKREEFKKYV